MVDPDKPGHITLSPICSPAKPIPEFCVPHLNKHKKRSRSGAAVNKPHGGRLEDRREAKQGVAPMKKTKTSEQSDETAGGGGGSVSLAKAPKKEGVISQAERIKKKQEMDEQKRLRTLALAPKPIVIPVKKTIKKT